MIIVTRSPGSQFHALFTTSLPDSTQSYCKHIFSTLCCASKTVWNKQIGRGKAEVYQYYQNENAYDIAQTGKHTFPHFFHWDWLGQKVNNKNQNPRETCLAQRNSKVSASKIWLDNISRTQISLSDTWSDHFNSYILYKQPLRHAWRWMKTADQKLLSVQRVITTESM